MDDNTILKLAQIFETASQIQHDVTFSRKGVCHSISFNLLQGDFIHAIGLDHLPSIKSQGKHNLHEKKRMFSKFKKHGLRISDLSDEDKSELFSPIPKSYNPATQKPFTIADRVDTLLDIEQALENIPNGTVCKWDEKNATVSFQSKIEPTIRFQRRVDIKPDYVISIPLHTYNHPQKPFVQETEHLFLCFVSSGKKSRDGKDIVELISAFSDGVDITAAQTKGTILEYTRTDTKSKYTEITFQHPSKSRNNSIGNNVIYFKPQALPRADVLTAVDRPPQQKSILDRLRDFVSGIAAKIRQAFSSPMQQRPAARQRHSAAPAQRQTAKRDKGTANHADRADQDRAHGEPQQAAARTAHTISRAKRSDITAQAQRAGHTDKAQQRGAQTHSHDDVLS